jgi:hypothetical protein
LAGPLGSVGRVEGGYDAGPCGYNSFCSGHRRSCPVPLTVRGTQVSLVKGGMSRGAETAVSSSMSLAEDRALRRDANAQSFQESGTTRVHWQAVNINQLDKPVLIGSSIRLARLATHSGDLGEGRLAVICNSPATCDDRRPRTADRDPRYVRCPGESLSPTSLIAPCMAMDN